MSRGISLGKEATRICREGTLRTGLVGFHSQISHRLAGVASVFSDEIVVLTHWVQCKRFRVKSFFSSREAWHKIKILKSEIIQYFFWFSTGCTKPFGGLAGYMLYIRTYVL